MGMSAIIVVAGLALLLALGVGIAIGMAVASFGRRDDRDNHPVDPNNAYAAPQGRGAGRRKSTGWVVLLLVLAFLVGGGLLTFTAAGFLLFSRMEVQQQQIEREAQAIEAEMAKQRESMKELEDE